MRLNHNRASRPPPLDLAFRSGLTLMRRAFCGVKGFGRRGRQIRALTTLLSPASPSPNNIVLHGLTATGKSSITNAVLESVAEDDEAATKDFAIIKSAEALSASPHGTCLSAPLEKSLWLYNGKGKWRCARTWRGW